MQGTRLLRVYLGELTIQTLAKQCVWNWTYYTGVCNNKSANINGELSATIHSLDINERQEK